jgi:predicted RNA binding protein YcfA (HicA-like mRNA interferase family)
MAPPAPMPTLPLDAVAWVLFLAQTAVVCIMRTVKSTALIRELKATGWVLDRIRGSHHVFNHPSRPGHVVVPHPKKDLGIGLVAAIRRQAGL